MVWPTSLRGWGVVRLSDGICLCVPNWCFGGSSHQVLSSSITFFFVASSPGRRNIRFSVPFLGGPRREYDVIVRIEERGAKAYIFYLKVNEVIVSFIKDATSGPSRSPHRQELALFARCSHSVCPDA